MCGCPLVEPTRPQAGGGRVPGVAGQRPPRAVGAARVSLAGQPAPGEDTVPTLSHVAVAVDGVAVCAEHRAPGREAGACSRAEP